MRSPTAGWRARRPSSPATTSGTARSDQAALDGAHVRLGTVRADDAGSHLVHHVADGGPGVEVHEDDRAAPPAPVAGPSLRDVGHRVGLGQRVADAEAERDAEDEVRAVA